MSVRTLIALRPAAAPALTWGQRIARARALSRSRRALAGLTPQQRADVGLTAAQAQTEAARPFWDAQDAQWDAPRHWRH